MFIQALKCSHCLSPYMKNDPLWALFRFTLLSFSSSLLSFISLVANERLTRSHSMLFTSHLVQGFKLMIFFSWAYFSNLSAAVKSATRYARLSGVFRVHWLKNINSLVSGKADLQYIGITGRSCAVIHSISLVLNPFHSLPFSLREHTGSFMMKWNNPLCFHPATPTPEKSQCQLLSS